MSLVEWNPFKELNELTRDIGHFFERPMGYLDRYSVPRADVYETDKDVVVHAEIPGMSKDDLNLYVDEDYIRFSGEKQRTNEVKDENIYRSERFYGSFSRIIPLPTEVQADNARAEYKDGILTVVIPKSQKASVRGRKVPIQ